MNILKHSWNKQKSKTIYLLNNHKKIDSINYIKAVMNQDLKLQNFKVLVCINRLPFAWDKYEDWEKRAKAVDEGREAHTATTAGAATVASLLKELTLTAMGWRREEGGAVMVGEGRRKERRNTVKEVKESGLSGEGRGGWRPMVKVGRWQLKWRSRAF